MKNSQILMMLLAAAALSTACQKTLDRTEPRPSDGEKGYVSLSLNLPTVSGTKSNDDFNAGDGDEYKVNNAIVAFFYGTSESEAVCEYAVRIGKAEFEFEAPNTNITSKYRTGALEIPAKEESEKVYALAVLNPASYISVTADNKLSVSGATDNLKLSKLQEFVTVDFNHGNGFMMTNAPSSPAPFSESITTLTEVTVYNEKSGAEAAPAPIYVERVEAKVTLEADNNPFEIVNTAFAGAKVTLDGWVLQNTNRTYCPVRKTDEAWLDLDYHRFAGLNSPYRIYWAEDGNYKMITDEETLKRNFNIFTADAQPSAAEWSKVSEVDPDPQYCAENTTEAKAMNKKYLTGVLIKATYVPSGSNEGDDFIIAGDVNTIYTTNEFTSAVQSALGSTPAVAVIATEGMTVTDAAGLKELITIDGKAPSEEQAGKILPAFGNSIRFYKDGVCYYTSLIRHFNDEQTPIDANDPTKNSVSSLEEYNDAAHLGRYGVVRNNWYQLNITGISGPGEPFIPEIPDESADINKSYISSEINILSWAVREQDIEL